MIALRDRRSLSPEYLVYGSLGWILLEISSLIWIILGDSPGKLSVAKIDEMRNEMIGRDKSWLWFTYAAGVRLGWLVPNEFAVM